MSFYKREEECHFRKKMENLFQTVATTGLGAPLAIFLNTFAIMASNQQGRWLKKDQWALVKERGIALARYTNHPNHCGISKPI